MNGTRVVGGGARVATGLRLRLRLRLAQSIAGHQHGYTHGTRPTGNINNNRPDFVLLPIAPFLVVCLPGLRDYIVLMHAAGNKVHAYRVDYMR